MEMGGHWIAKYHLHRDFLRYHSYLFRTQYDDGLKISVAPQLRVEAPDAPTVGRFMEWAYTLKIDKTNCDQQDFIFLWIFAENIGAPELQNYSISCLHRFRKGHCEPITPELLSFLYQQTREESPLKKYVVDTWDDKIPVNVIDGYPPDLLRDLEIVKKAKVDQSKKIRTLDIEKYFVDELEVADRFLNPEIPEPVKEIQGEQWERGMRIT